MTEPLSKVYDPKALEGPINALWLEGSYFHAEPARDGQRRKAFTIVIPPPNVTAALHLGHALNNTLQDILIRWRRMQQHETLWMPGTDHAGIATQTVVDKRLQSEGQPALKDYKRLEAEGKDGRRQFVAKVQAWKDEYEATILGQLKAMGCSCDWQRTRFTMDEVCARAVRAAFFKLFQDGLIYRGKRLVNWDPATQTVLADDEVEHETIQGHFWYLKYPLVEPVVLPRDADILPARVADVPSARAEGVPSARAEGVPPLSSTAVSAVSGEGVPPLRVADVPSARVEGILPSERQSEPTINKRMGRYLPHWSKEDAVYSVTFRLADAVPREVSEAWHRQHQEIVQRAEQQGRPLSYAERGELQKLHSEKIEAFLDAGHGDCLLRDPRAAQVVQNALRHFHGERYEIIAWAIMPNHVHAVLKPLAGHELPKIIQSWKSFTAKEINRLLDRRGTLWMDEYYDHLIRDEKDFVNQINYAVTNPEKAGLQDWPWCGVMGRTCDEERGHDALDTRGRDVRDTDGQDARATQGRDVRDTDGQDARATQGRDALATPIITHVTVATTRPETMLGDTAVAMNPADPRAKCLVGKMVRLPIVGRVIPIIADEHVVLPDPQSEDEKARFSTGFLKVTPAHDPDDWEIGQRHDLPVINVMAPDGSISDKHGWTDWDQIKNPDVENLIGLDRFEAREAVVEWFRQENLLEEVRDYTHEVGHSYRSHVPIEPYLSDQWYIAVKRPIADCRLRLADWIAAHQELLEKKEDVEYLKGTDVPVDSLAGLALAPLLDGRLRFIPERYAKTYQTWLEDLRDWPISRQLWWGHRIPVWTIELARAAHTHMGSHETDAQVEERMEREFFDGFEEFLRECEIREEVAWYRSQRMIEGRYPLYVCAISLRAHQALDMLGGMLAHGRGSSTTPEIVDEYYAQNGEFKEEFGENAFNTIGKFRGRIGTIGRDPDVLDTWFSSALWPISTLGWPEETAELKTFYPTDALCTAREIIKLWVSRMVMFGQYFRGDIPFRDVYIHAMIQDGEGRKMSKSLGNGIDPLVAIDSHGADAMRFTLASMTTDTQDIRMPVAAMTLPDGREVNTSPKFDLGRNFCNKLWNASRFALMNLEGLDPAGFDAGQMDLTDRWILSRLAATRAEVTESLEAFQFSEPLAQLYRFFWNDLCDWYLEWLKPRMRDPQSQGTAQNVLAFVLDCTLRLLHPFVPFITEGIYQKLHELAPARELKGLASVGGAPALTVAPWPGGLDPLRDAAAEEQVRLVQEVVRVIRDLRSKYNLAPGEKLTASAGAPADAAGGLNANRELVCQLAGLGDFRAAEEMAKPNNAATAIVENIQVYVHGVIDPEAERARLVKQRQEIEHAKQAVENKLANQNFVTKAKPEVVAQARARLQQLQEQLQALEQHLAELGG